MKTLLCILGISLLLGQPLTYPKVYAQDEESVDKEREDHRPEPLPLVRFEHPWVKHFDTKYALDWCYNWATHCGQEAADAFCQSKHLQRAETFSQEPGVSPT